MRSVTDWNVDAFLHLCLYFESLCSLCWTNVKAQSAKLGSDNQTVTAICNMKNTNHF